MFGAHRFYVGKTGTGILQLMTVGGLGIWWLYDVIKVASGSFRDREGKRVVRWQEAPLGARNEAVSGQHHLPGEVMEELYALRDQVNELEERVDFAERLLTSGRDQEAG
jgi:hypothetical protein